MIPMNPNTDNSWVFNVTLHLKEGLYFYYYVVDGKVRFAPDQPSTIDYQGRIVNYIEILKNETLSRIIQYNG